MKHGWPKACRCGETWSRDEWNELPPIGRYRAEEILELRSCVCGATLAVEETDLETATPAEPTEPVTPPR